MVSSYLIPLGDLRLTVALAGAVAAWMIANRLYRQAWRWCARFVGAMGLVALSKIVYLGWGMQLGALSFRAVSGHAAGAAAVLPVVLYLLAMPTKRVIKNWAFIGGWLISIALVFALVTHGEHTLSEALAGWFLGACASASTWTSLRHMVVPFPMRSAGSAFTALAMIALCMQVVPVGWWMVSIARTLSGAQHAHGWTGC